MRYFYPKYSNPQEQIKYDLKRFWVMFKFSTSLEFKYKVLKEYSVKRYFYKTQQPLKKKRANFNNLKSRNTPVRNKIAKPCFCCGERSECRHHIIQLTNGGINGKRNIVQLCNNCHAEIHPWLKSKRYG